MSIKNESFWSVDICTKVSHKKVTACLVSFHFCKNNVSIDYHKFQTLVKLSMHCVLTMEKIRVWIRKREKIQSMILKYLSTDKE